MSVLRRVGLTVVVRIASPSGGAIYKVGQVVPTSFSCSEAAGGPGVASCEDSSGIHSAPGLSPATSATGQLSTASPGRYTYAVTALSADGESATASISYTVAAAPSITFATPLSGKSYKFGNVVAVKYSCTEGASGPGIGSCTGTDPNGKHLDTDTPGSYTFTVTATSKDGQRISKSIPYEVETTPGGPFWKLTVHGQPVMIGTVLSSIRCGGLTLLKLSPEPGHKEVGKCLGTGAVTLTGKLLLPHRIPRSHKAATSGTLVLYSSGPHPFALTFTLNELVAVSFRYTTVSKATVVLDIADIVSDGCTPKSACEG